MRDVVLVWVVLTLCALTHSVYADPRDPVAAEGLFRRGREAMKRKDYKDACPKFAESQRLDPAPGTLINLALCEEELGRVASAWQHWRVASEQLAADDPRLNVAKTKIADLERRLPRLTITLPAGASSGTTVSRDGVKLGPASLGVPIPVDPGEHTIVTALSGRELSRAVVRLEEGESRSVETSGQGQKDVIPAASPETSALPWRPIGFALGGVGIVGLGVGTVFALRAKSKDDDARAGGCDDTTCAWGDERGLDLTRQSQDAARVAQVAFVAGSAFVIGGAAMVLFASSSKVEKGGQVLLTPSIGRSLAGLEARATW